ncbi:outer membrane protein assembly factor BamD [Rhodocaloribacter litoris]|uniref:outer membrane protein assembly factor BamD n=1 Tax=Rhodocaloribacter litoris TaxID=2558931 RepID=UPI00142490A3|nr:outer membrane protein assembly factor BamD [Rhodocaloribacter litoris]QXD16458.1 outer membrane protein assembly factor BamD [Rhodocaloribacter litoris]GIV59427.1 MAG: outer membrane protein assembly factor BamD [Rhodothermaceae bacterium]
MFFRLRLPLLVLTTAVVLAGCSGTGRLRYETPQEALEKGMALYEEGKYDRAILYLQGVFDFGRTHEYAADAQLYLARAYYANEDYLLAASEYNRFVQIYRSDPRVPDAEFELAMTYYKRSPPYPLDQTDTEAAIERFQLFLNRYPNHPKVAEAEAYIRELREKLARKQYEAGRLYERRELFEAAARSYEAAFDRYPDTSWADDALVGAMRAYIAFSDQSIRARQRERLQPALEHYERLIQLFPESPLLKEAEALYEEITERLKRLDEETS